MLTPHNSGLASRDSGLSAIDVLYHPTSHSQAGACPLPPTCEADLDAAGIARAFVSQCKRWSCDRQWMCVDTRLDDVLRYTEASPRYVGLAGYNPFDIAESLRDIELAVAQHGFRGAYVHAASFNLPLTNAHMYPLFAKAAELGVPVLAQVPPTPDLVAEAAQLTSDFPELPLVLAQARPELSCMTALACACDNVYFALDPGALNHLRACSTGLAPERDNINPELIGIVQQRCMWGSNGMEWSDALRATDFLAMLPGIRSSFLYRTAERVFALGQPPASRAPRSANSEILAAER